MIKKYDFLPYKFRKEEVALAPISWRKTMLDYSNFRKKAFKEEKPGTYVFLATLLAAIVKHDRHLVNTAIELTKDNVPKYFYLSLAGTALHDFGLKQEGLSMIREAVKQNPKHSILMNLAAATSDLDEKEELAKKVLTENPKDSDAAHHLAYAKYFKGERKEAESLFDEILLNEPQNIYALESKGNIYFDRKEYDKALQQYLKIRLKPVPIQLQFKICHCYYLLRKIIKAKKIAKRLKDKLHLVYDLEMKVENANELLAEILKTKTSWFVKF